jgi:glycosyltransferase involved in cell wall biosynthesis
MRIAFLTVDFGRRTSGGIGTYLDTLATALSHAGHEVFVITPHPGSRDARPYEVVHIQAVAASATRRLELAERFLECLSELHGRSPLDIVEATDWGVEGLACVRSTELPVIVRLHTPESMVVELNDDSRLLDSASVVAVEGEYLSRAAALSAPSRAIARRFGDRNSLLRVVPNPLPSGMPESVDAAASLPLRVVFLGRLERRKGVFVLVEALKQLFKVETEMVVDFVGPDTRLANGSVGQQLREALAPWCEQVHFHGYLEGLTKLAVVQAGHIVVLPSLWENFPYAALEALACGRPVIATSGSGYEDLIEPGVDGLLVPPGDFAELATALIRVRSLSLASSSELQRRVSRFSPAVVVPQMVSFYEEVIATWRQK